MRFHIQLNIICDFIAGDKVITVRQSRYSNHAITQIADVRPARCLNMSMDTHALAELKAAIAEIEHRMSYAKQKLDGFTEEESAMKRIREGLTQKKSDCSKILADVRLLTTRLGQKRNQRSAYEREAIDLDAEERNVKQKCGVCKCFIVYTLQCGVFNK